MRTPEETVRTVANGVCRLMRGTLSPEQEAAQLDELAACYAETTHVSHPMRPLGDEPLTSRAAVRRHFMQGGPPTGVERYDIRHDTVHLTADPEVVVFEFEYDGVVRGRSFGIRCVFITRVRDGEIIESRDYVDHVAGARGFGHLAALAHELADER